MPETIINEIWKPVVGYEGWDSVSDLGRVRRDAPGRGTKVGHILKPQIAHRGYFQVILSRKGVEKTIKIYHLVGEAFLGPCPLGQETNHRNANKSDNQLWNLEYLTHAENVMHAVANKLMPCGSQHGRAKLNESQVTEIRKRHSAGETQQHLANEFGVSQATIGRIARREHWTHC